MNDDHRRKIADALRGQPKSDAHRAAIAVAARRIAQYRADFVAFMEWTFADVADEAERRAVQIKLARRLVINAPKDDRDRWRRWSSALERGATIAVKTYKPEQKIDVH